MPRQGDITLDEIERQRGGMRYGRQFATDRDRTIGGDPRQNLEDVDYTLFDNNQGGGGGRMDDPRYGSNGGPGARRPGSNDPLRPDVVTNPESRVRRRRDSRPELGESLGQHYDDSYGRLLSGLAQGGQSSDIFQDVLRNYRGNPSELRDFQDSPAFRMAMAYGIQNSDEYARSRDYSGYDDVFQAGAGDFASGAAQATSQGNRALARSGQGRNAAMRAAIAGQAAQGASQQTTSLRGQVQMQKLQQAQRAFEQQRQLAALATGQIMPRTEKEGDSQELSTWANIGINALDIIF